MHASKATSKPQPRKASVKKRTCLKCDKPFVSWGPGNRRCGNCTSSHEHGATPEQSYRLVVPSGRRTPQETI
jgi:hypothetical protein